MTSLQSRDVEAKLETERQKRHFGVKAEGKAVEKKGLEAKVEAEAELIGNKQERKRTVEADVESFKMVEAEADE